jgi:hypothetical protein
MDDIDIKHSLEAALAFQSKFDLALLEQPFQTLLLVRTPLTSSQNTAQDL